jgi:hypothetical protein
MKIFLWMPVLLLIGSFALAQDAAPDPAAPTDTAQAPVATVSPDDPTLDCLSDNAATAMASDLTSQAQQVVDGTTTCCQNPSTCGSDGSGGGGGSNSQLTTMMMTMSIAMLMQSDSSQMQGMSALCSSLGGLGNGGTQYNANQGNKCTSSVAACTRETSRLSKIFTAKINAGNALTNGCGTVSTLKSAQAQVRSRIQDCGNIHVNTAVTQQTQNMQNSGSNSNAMQAVCNQLAQAAPQQFPQLTAMAAPASAMDCSNPVAAMSPACTQQICASDPTNNVCLKAVTDSGASTASFNKATGDNGSFAVGSAADGRIAQNPQFGSPTASTPSTANPIPPGGSGGAGGMGMGPSQTTGQFGIPDNRNGAAAGGGGRGYNTDVLGNERGGGGYTQNNLAVPDGAGGFPGYGLGLRAAPHLDLKAYLPGGRLNQRSIAGVGSPNPDIAARGTDLFQRISDRFKVICSSNRLRDCEIAHVSHDVPPGAPGVPGAASPALGQQLGH